MCVLMRIYVYICTDSGLVCKGDVATDQGYHIIYYIHTHTDIYEISWDIYLCTYIHVYIHTLVFIKCYKYM